MPVMFVPWSPKPAGAQNYDILWVKNVDEEPMDVLPPNEYLEVRNGGYYVAGTRVGLDVIAHDFREGNSPEAILQSYPSIGSLARIYGAIAFILEHAAAVERYLCEQGALWEELKDRRPLPDEMRDRFRQTQNARV